MNNKLDAPTPEASKSRRVIDDDDDDDDDDDEREETKVANSGSNRNILIPLSISYKVNITDVAMSI